MRMYPVRPAVEIIIIVDVTEAACEGVLGQWVQLDLQDQGAAREYQAPWDRKDRRANLEFRDILERLGQREPPDVYDTLKLPEKSVRIP